MKKLYLKLSGIFGILEPNLHGSLLWWTCRNCVSGYPSWSCDRSVDRRTSVTNMIGKLLVHSRRVTVTWTWCTVTWRADPRTLTLRPATYRDDRQNPGGSPFQDGDWKTVIRVWSGYWPDKFETMVPRNPWSMVIRLPPQSIVVVLIHWYQRTVYCVD